VTLTLVYRFLDRPWLYHLEQLKEEGTNDHRSNL